MTKSQIATIRRLTTAVARVTTDGTPSFAVHDICGSGNLLLSATNAYDDLGWYQGVENFFCTIGPRGGIKRKSGTLARWVA